MPRTNVGRASANVESKSSALSENEEVEIDDEGPSGPRSREFKVRVTKTMLRDLKHAAADTDQSMGALALEGIRWVLYSAPCRHVGVVKRAS